MHLVLTFYLDCATLMAQLLSSRGIKLTLIKAKGERELKSATLVSPTVALTVDVL